jgi:peptidoglycan hydrolase-like protein with peptidoglycan-binding domain
VWYCIPITSAQQRQEDHEFKANLSYKVRTVSKHKKETKKNFLNIAGQGGVANVCNPSTGEAEAGGSRVQGQTRLRTRDCLKKPKKKKRKEKILK